MDTLEGWSLHMDMVAGVRRPIARATNGGGAQIGGSLSTPRLVGLPKLPFGLKVWGVYQNSCGLR